MILPNLVDTNSCHLLRKNVHIGLQTVNNEESETERDALLWLHQQPHIEHLDFAVESSQAKKNSLKIFVRVLPLQ